MIPTASRRPTARTPHRGPLPVSLLWLGLALGGVPAAALAEGDAQAGEQKAHTCLGCHGIKHYVNSYPTYKVPFIAGQNAEYLVQALQAYKSKERPHQTMQANAGLLSDQDIEDIAAWFAAQGKPSP